MRIWPGKRRLAIAVVGIFALSCAGAWIYTAIEARRAESMMVEASRIKIGDTESSVLPLIERYRGEKWAPGNSTRNTLSPRDTWIDPEEYDRALRIYPDYFYSIAVNPWGFPTLAPSSGSPGVLRSAMNVIPSRLRSLVGLRDWISFVDIRIRDGRVSEVGGTVLVEGRSRWLNHSWDLADERLLQPSPLRPYTIQSENVLMTEGRSLGIRNLITSQASEEQTEAAHSWNKSCVVSLLGCSNSCELSPRAFQYWKAHPDKSGAIWTPTCD